MKTITVITYDFFYQANRTPWFCSYAVSVMIGDKTVHSELIQLSEQTEFERLQERVIKESFEKQSAYENSETGTYSETYMKIFGVE